MRQPDAILNSINEITGHFPGAVPLDEQAARTRLRDQQTFNDVKAAVKVLADTINGSGNAPIIRAAIVDELLRTHRYLENDLIITVLQALGDIGALNKQTPARYSDARNETAMKLCGTIREKFENELFWR
jgi:hypothetical protein